MSQNKEASQRKSSNLRYHAYLIRCWREENDWRYSLETVGRIPERRGFTSLQELAGHLEARLKKLDDQVEESS